MEEIIHLLNNDNAVENLCRLLDLAGYRRFFHYVSGTLQDESSSPIDNTIRGAVLSFGSILFGPGISLSFFCPRMKKLRPLKFVTSFFMLL